MDSSQGNSPLSPALLQSRRKSPVRSAPGLSPVLGRCQVRPGEARARHERLQVAELRPGPPCTLAVSPGCAPGVPSGGRAGLDPPHSGSAPCPPAARPGLQPGPRARLASPSSGREGGVSAAGGREPYKRAGGAAAPASLATSRWDRSAAAGTGRGEGAALGLPNAWTICRRCPCNMLELQNS